MEVLHGERNPDHVWRNYLSSSQCQPRASGTKVVKLKVNHHRIVAAHLAQHALRTAMGRLSQCSTSSHCHRKAYGHPIHQLVPRKV